jgi:acyl-coenzyme A synthetase/AMP-(fatty) acid ligase
VAEAAVVGEPDPLLGERIVGYVVACPGQSLDTQTLLRFCLERLPRFKVPARVHIVEALPRNASGKIQRAALRGSTA